MFSPIEIFFVIACFVTTGRIPRKYKGHSEGFFSKFSTFFRAIFQSYIFSCFFPIIGTLTNWKFLVLENFTNSDRAPPYIDTCLQSFPNFGKIWKKRSPMRMNPSKWPNVRTFSSPYYLQYRRLPNFVCSSKWYHQPNVFNAYCLECPVLYFYYYYCAHHSLMRVTKHLDFCFNSVTT